MKQMNKSLMFFVAVGLLSLMMSSCTTYSYTSRSTSIRPNEMSSRSLGAEINVDFSRRVTATSDPQILKADAINNAQYKCINENNIDVVVDPIYKVEFNMFQKKAYKVTVVGYAGTYKQVPTGVDAVVEKKYSVEDIEKYKLINDPTFYQYYYQKDPVQGGDVTNYFINSNGGAPVMMKEQPTSMMVRPTAVPKKGKVAPVASFDYKKAKQLRDAGIGLFSTGVVELGLVFPLMLCINGNLDEYEYFARSGSVTGSSNMYYRRGMAQWNCSWFFCALGCASIISGIPMWAVGSHRMKKASAPQLAIGGTKDGLGMRLTF